MRNYSCTLLVVVIMGIMLGGCANKEAVKAEEAVAPAVITAPEAAPAPVPPEPPKPASSPAIVKVEAAQEPTVPAEVLPTAPAETLQKGVLEAIHFDFDKSDLREHERAILTANAGIIMDKLKGHVQIQGHCDERGAAEYNLALGERRAMSAMNYLVALGVSEDRLSIVSYGEEKPVDPGHDEGAWAKNRRAEFVIRDK